MTASITHLNRYRAKGAAMMPSEFPPPTERAPSEDERLREQLDQQQALQRVRDVRWRTAAMLLDLVIFAGLVWGAVKVWEWLR